MSYGNKKVLGISCALLAAVALASLACAGWPARGEEPAKNRGSVNKTSPTDPSAQIDVDRTHYKYVGTKRCRMCHSAQYESWLTTPKAHSFDVLKPGERKKAKTLAGLDSAVDYRTDSSCLPCHTVGYNQLGGYVVPSLGNAKQKRWAKARESAGCESCHGPGSEFVKIMSDILNSNRFYDVAELRAAGRHLVTQQTCNACHNEHAICVVHKTEQPGDDAHRSRFEVQVDNRKGYHKLFPLKFRRNQASQESETIEKTAGSD